MAKLTVVLTYFNREKQLFKTLDSFRQYNYDFNVVIVDDNSPEDIKLPDLPYEVTILKLGPKTWINPSPVAFNTGFNYALKANPEIIIIQNAECYHIGDVVGYAIKSVSVSNYITFACYSLGKDQDIDLKTLNNVGASGNGDSAWYNHSKYRPVALHFCTAISADNLRKVNGFDERLSMGIGYEDDLFIHQIKMLRLKVEIIDNPFVFHQYHYDQKWCKFDQELYDNTGKYCNQLKAERKFRAEHILTPNFDVDTR
jgi:glycosyltransferase involved in cell wall biosynthesis